MRILHVTSEITPIAKVGGLGDVLMGLTRELASRGHEVLVILPFYGCIDVAKLTDEKKEDSFETICEGEKQRGKISYFRAANGVEVGLFDTETSYFRREKNIYGEVGRFLSFSRAVAEYLRAGRRKFDIVHLHDWPAALVSLFYRVLIPQDPSFSTVFTIHNFEYQGRCSWDDVKMVGFSREDFQDPSCFQDPAYDCLNSVKAGLLTCDRATTVSPTYAKEVLTPQGGTGLDKVLASLGSRFQGVLNGIDDLFWNPAHDPYLSCPYSLESKASVRTSKRQNKHQLFSKLGLKVLDDLPLLISVTRLVQQKGIYMIRDLFAQAEELQFQCVLLGSVPEQEAELAFKELDSLLRAKKRGAVFLGSQEELSHELFAASDIFVAPSLFEPCGLTQLIALKYGSIPIVRKTGGLADTIVDVDVNRQDGNGFLFETPTSESFIATARRALLRFKDPEGWSNLMKKGMSQDFSWRNPGDQYEALYTHLK
jgi:starch synthase